jgi:aminopeptidase-like protein
MFKIKYNSKIANKIFNLIKDLFPLNRSLTGDGNAETIKKIKKIITKIRILKFKSGSKVFDWTVPKEWNVKDAYILDPQKKKICDFKKNNLHLVGYSQPIKKNLNLSSLKKYLFSLDKIPDAIPYITSYYDKIWGFCISKNQLKKLKKGNYKVLIDSSFKNGNLIVGEYVKKGKSKKEILFSCNICHPSMANNELSGPTIQTFLAEQLSKINTYYTYRFIYVPETVGCLAYISKNLKNLKNNLFAGFHLTCIGLGKNLSIIKTKNESSYTNKILSILLKDFSNNYNEYSYLDRGSDERQYNAPGIELPVATVMRTKFGSFKEYHTSKDNLKILKLNEIKNSFEFLIKLIEFIENDYILNSKIIGEPFFRKRNMYRKLGTKNSLSIEEQDLFNVAAYAKNIRVSDLCLKLNRKPSQLFPVIDLLSEKKIIELKR